MAIWRERLNRVPLNDRFAVLLALLLAAWLLAADLLWLDQIPWAPTIDDGTYAAAAYGLVTTGRAGFALGTGLLALDRDMVMYGRVPALLSGAAQLLLGTTGFAARLPSLLIVGLTSALVWGIARRAGLPPRIGWTAALLWFVSIPARMLAHSNRPDAAFLLFVVASAIVLFYALDDPVAWRFLAAGALAGLSLEAHLIGSALAVTVAAMAFCFSPRGRRLQYALLVGLGAIPGALLWLYIHALSQPEVFRLQWGGLWQHWAPAPILHGPSAALDAIARRYEQWFWSARYHRYLFEAPFLVAALVVGFRRGGLQLRLASFVIAFHAALALLAWGDHAGYMFAVYPLLCVLLAATFFGSAGRLLPLAGLVLFTFHLAQVGYWIARRDPPLPSQARQDVLRHVGDRRFLAADNLWFYLSDSRTARSVVALNFAPYYARDRAWASVVDEYLRRENVEFVVVETVFENYLTPAQRAFFAERTGLIQEYRYGPRQWIRIYKLTLG